MTASELVQQALAEYETAHGEPCTNAVIIARQLNKRGTSATTETTQEPKDAQDLADEQEIIAYVEANDPEHVKGQPLKPGTSYRSGRRVRGAGSDKDKFDGLWLDKLAAGLSAKHGDTTYVYRPDFGQSYHLRSTTTTTETPSRAEQELGRAIDGREVAEIWKAL